MSGKPDYTRMSLEVFDSGAALYHKKYADVSAYSASLNLFLDSLPANACVLDVACGPGNLGRYLLDRRPDLRLTGVDLAPHMLELARQICPEAVFEEMDARHIGQLPSSFDGVLCGFGLPYLNREEAITLIANAANILKTNGLIYLSTMEDAYEKSSMQTSTSTGQSLFMHFHEAGYLTEALHQHGFNIRSTQRISYDSSAGLVTDLVMVGSKR